MRCHNDRKLKARVELPELRFRHAGQFRRRFKVNIARLCNPYEEGLVANVGQFNAIAARILHDALDSLQFRNVVGRLSGHFQMCVVCCLVASFSTLNSSPNTSFTPIVGSERQLPVIKHPVQIFKVVECCTSAFQYIVSVIAPEVLFKSIIRACCRHELPKARRFCARKGFGLEGTFYKRQKCELHWQSARLHLFDDVVEILTRTHRHALHILRILGVIRRPPIHQRRIQFRNTKTSANSIPNAGGHCGLTLQSRFR